MNKSQQEFLFKLSMYEQQIGMIQQQLQAVEESLVEITGLNFGLDDVKNSVGKETLAPIGRGIFAKTKLMSDELIVDVGGKNFVTKSVRETKDIIEEQIGKLSQIKTNLNEKAEEIREEMNFLLNEMQKSEES